MYKKYIYTYISGSYNYCCNNTTAKYTYYTQTRLISMLSDCLTQGILVYVFCTHIYAQ